MTGGVAEDGRGGKLDEWCAAKGMGNDARCREMELRP